MRETSVLFLSGCIPYDDLLLSVPGDGCGCSIFFIAWEIVVMAIEPLAIGVCSWSLQVKSVPELRRCWIGSAYVVQIACGDPHHAAWDEGDKLPEAARRPAFR